MSGNRDTQAFDVDAELEAAFAAAQPRQEEEQPLQEAEARPQSSQIWQIDDVDLNRSRPTPPRKKPWWVWAVLGLVALATGLLVYVAMGGVDPPPEVINGIEMLPVDRQPSNFAAFVAKFILVLGTVAVLVWFFSSKYRREALFEGPKKVVTWPFRKIGQAARHLLGRKTKEDAPPEEEKPVKEEATRGLKQPETAAEIRQRVRAQIIGAAVAALVIVAGTWVALRYLMDMPQPVHGDGLIIYGVVAIGVQAYGLYLVNAIRSNIQAKLSVALGSVGGQILAWFIAIGLAVGLLCVAKVMVYDPWLVKHLGQNDIGESRWVMWLKIAGLVFVPLWLVKAMTRATEEAGYKEQRALQDVLEKEIQAKAKAEAAAKATETAKVAPAAEAPKQS